MSSNVTTPARSLHAGIINPLTPLANAYNLTRVKTPNDLLLRYKSTGVVRDAVEMVYIKRCTCCYDTFTVNRQNNACWGYCPTTGQLYL